MQTEPALSELPQRFLERLSDLVPPSRLPGVLASLSSPRATAFRVNTFCADHSEVRVSLESQGLAPVEIASIPGAYSVAAERRRALTRTPEFERGAIYLQNPSSMLPPLVLRPSSDERVLDLAAAPGSKTLQMAELMGNRGWISAVESVRERFFRLRANLARHGAANVHTYLKDGTRVWRQVAEQFDKVLLDAPCSSEGQFHLNDPASFRFWSERKIAEMSRKQKRLLYSAIQCARSGGEIVYSTCTLAPEENEAVVDAMLAHFEGAVTVEPLALSIPGIEPGRTAWRRSRYHDSLRAAARVLPDTQMQGFFICRLRKHSATGPAVTDRGQRGLGGRRRSAGSRKRR